MDAANMKIGLGIIGLGFIGQLHLKHALQLKGASVEAVADISKKALAKAKESGAKKTYTDYNDLLRDPEVDAVVIALPTHLHLECARRAAEGNKHIFLEKPLSRNVEEGREIIASAERNRVKLMVGYPLRFNRSFIELRKKVKSGALGEVEVAYATYISSGPFFHRAEGYIPVPVPDWWFKRELTGGGVLVDLGSHMIDLLRWYFGEISDIKGHFGYRFNMDLEDEAICVIVFKSGTLSILNVGWFSQSYELKVSCFGTVAHAEAQNRAGNPFTTLTQMLTLGTSSFHLPHLQELQYFINCVDHDRTPSPSGLDGLKDLEAITLAYKNHMWPDSYQKK
jgi:myo-inositol 2-dehydrogenase / D-chiro-inositol 1-dehydrogenase